MDNMNAAQQKAVTHTEGPMLVLAGPGSGKTFVITQRVRYLIEKMHVRPDKILVITFTKAAACQMQQRFFKLMGDKSVPVSFGTFHAVFFQILKNTYRFNADNIIKEREKYNLLSAILEELKREKRYEENSTANTSENIQLLLSEIGSVKNKGRIGEEGFNSMVVEKDEFKHIYEAYKNEMRANRKIDFDDMILMCRELLMSRDEVRELWQDRFEYILIDEFQDISPMQYDVMRILAQPQDNLFIVGDDDQSIYGFRGSEPSIMLNFTKDYPNAEKVLLNINYRSAKAIVQSSLVLISNNRVRFKKDVEADNKCENGVRKYCFSSKKLELDGIVDLISQYMSMENSSYRDIALIYRTNNNMAYIAQRLSKADIPYIMKEKPVNMYNTPVARDIISYIRYALYQDNPECFYRIMNKPSRYIKRSTVPTIAFSMSELVSNNREYEYVVKNILKLYNDLRFMESMTPYAAINYIRRGIGYDSYLQKESESLNNGMEKLRDSMEMLDNLMENAKNFDTLKEWLYFAENYDKLITDDKPDEADRDAVSIVTMHASKGLEWKNVILPDINEGVIPHKKALTDSQIEEERRLFYVAMTRARENLFLFYVNDKETGNILPSRFLDEIIV